jgi:hypothetical protein
LLNFFLSYRFQNTYAYESNERHCEEKFRVKILVLGFTSKSGNPNFKKAFGSTTPVESNKLPVRYIVDKIPYSTGMFLSE